MNKCFRTSKGQHELLGFHESVVTTLAGINAKNIPRFIDLRINPYLPYLRRE